MNWYKDRNGVWWSPAQRRASARKTKAARAAGLIPPPVKCNRCGSTKRVRYHNADYSDPIAYLEPLCFGCHLKEHSGDRTAKERPTD